MFSSARRLPVLVIVADSTDVYNLVLSADPRRSYPVLHGDLESALSAVTKYPDKSRLLLVTDKVNSFSGAAKGAFVIDTDSSQEDLESFDTEGRVVHLRKTTDHTRIREIVRLMLKKLEGVPLHPSQAVD
jgi:hypothetical protein